MLRAKHATSSLLLRVVRHPERRRLAEAKDPDRHSQSPVISQCANEGLGIKLFV